MNGHLLVVAEEQLRSLLSGGPDAVPAFLFREAGVPELPDHLDLAKDWQALHFLLTGHPWHGEPPRLGRPRRGPDRRGTRVRSRPVSHPRAGRRGERGARGPAARARRERLHPGRLPGGRDLPLGRAVPRAPVRCPGGARAGTLAVRLRRTGGVLPGRGFPTAGGLEVPRLRLDLEVGRTGRRT